MSLFVSIAIMKIERIGMMTIVIKSAYMAIAPDNKSPNGCECMKVALR